jgi:elongation factor 1-beta
VILLARVAVTFRIMPEEAGSDLHAIKEGLKRALGPDLRDVAERPVAFGLVALEAIVVLDDAGGELERSEKAVRDVDGVSSVETLSVDLI